MTDGRTHWEGCWREHKDCELERLRQLADDLIAAEPDTADDYVRLVAALRDRARELRS